MRVNKPMRKNKLSRLREPPRSDLLAGVVVLLVGIIQLEGGGLVVLWCKHGGKILSFA